MRKWTSALLTLVGLGVVGGLVVERLSPRRSVASVREEMAPLEEPRTAPADRSDGWVSAGLPPAAVVEVAAAAAPSPRAAARPSRREGAEGDPKAAYLEAFAPIRDHLEAAFVGERRDPSWAADARDRALATFREALPSASRIVAVECRETLCRVDTEHQDYEGFRAFALEALASPDKLPWNGGVASGPVEKREGGALVATLYLTREGHPLDLPASDEP